MPVTPRNPATAGLGCACGAPTINPRVAALIAESGAKSDKCGAVPTVDVALSPAGRKPPPDESSCDEGDHGQDGHFIDPQSL
jgi:hypothetical protein